MGRKSGGNILMAFGVVLALSAGAVVFFVMQLNVAKSAEIPKGPVVVVGLVDVPERTIITADKVKVEQWPVDIIPPTAIKSAEEVTGKFAKTKLYARQAVLNTQVAGLIGGPTTATGAAAPAAGGATPVGPKQADVAYTLEKGKVLVAVSYPSAVPLLQAGAVQPGDRVDIIVKTPGTLGEQIAPIFRNIEIRAIGSVAVPSDPKAAGSGTLIFAVPPQDALILTFIESMEPRIILRAAGDTENSPTDLVTIEYISSRYGLQRPPVSKGP